MEDLSKSIEWEHEFSIPQSTVARLGSKGGGEGGLETRMLRTDHQKSGLFPYSTNMNLIPLSLVAQLKDPSLVALNFIHEIPILSSQVQARTAMVREHLGQCLDPSRCSISICE